MSTLTIYGIRLRQARERARLSRQQLSDVAGLPVMTIWRIETGQVRNPWMRTLLRLASALAIRLEELTR